MEAPPYVTWILFHAWAQSDEKAALAAFVNWPAHQETERRQAMVAMIASLGTAQPAAAAALARAHLPLLAAGTSSPRGSPFFEGFQKSDAFWNAIAGLPENPDRNKLLAAYLNLPRDNDNEVKRRWAEAPEPLRRALVAAGFRMSKEMRDPVFDALPAMILEHAVKTGDRRALSIGLVEQVRRDPDFLAESVALSQEKMTGRDRAEVPATLIGSAAERDFPKALDYWRSLPDGLLKARAAGALGKAAPPEYRTVMEAEISQLSPADIKRARQ